MTYPHGSHTDPLFTGLNAFPLTPFAEERIDTGALAASIERLLGSAVDAITVLGSTGSYAYLTREERRHVLTTAAEAAAGSQRSVPLFAGIGALRTAHVLQHAHDAQESGAAGLLLAPVSYQALTSEDVYGLFEAVSAGADVPVVVYDNPGTTHFGFTDELYAAVTALPHVDAIKIPGVPTNAAERVAQLRALLPEGVCIGVSGDVHGAPGLSAGCDVWFSVIAGVLPEQTGAIARAAQSGNAEEAQALSAELRPLWDLFARYGSLRVTAAVAEELGQAQRNCLPLPLRGLTGSGREQVCDLVGSGLLRG